jgi:hypothetical protein
VLNRGILGKEWILQNLNNLFQKGSNKKVIK